MIKVSLGMMIISSLGDPFCKFHHSCMLNKSLLSCAPVAEENGFPPPIVMDDALPPPIIDSADLPAPPPPPEKCNARL